jgi:hypothetical protein
MELPLRPNTRIHTPEGHFGNLCRRTIRRMPDDRTWRSLDASQAISMCVLRFRVSRLRRRTLARPVLRTGQTSTHQLEWWPWLCGSTKEPSGFLVYHRKPRELGVASANHHS